MLNSNRFVQARRVAGSLAAALVCVALAPLAVANNVIVLNSGKATLSLIDQASRQVVGTVPTGKEPHHLSGRLMSPTSHAARIAPPWPTPRLCQ